MTERPPNVRPSRATDRTHNSNRYQPAEGSQTTATRAYRGSHRAERMHRADGAHHRSSRMGRHHAEARQAHEDHQQNRW